MKKQEKIDLIQKAIQETVICRCYFVYDQNYFYYYPNAVNEKFFLGQEEDDFLLDGYCIRKISQLKKVEVKDDKCQEINGVCEYWFSQHIGVIPLHNRFVYMGTGHSDQVYMKVPGLRVCVSEGRIVRFELVYASHEEDTENTICLMNLEDFLIHLTREIDESPLEGVIHVNRITLEYTPIGVTEDIVNYRPSWCLYGQAGGIENVLIFDAGTGELLRH